MRTAGRVLLAGAALLAAGAAAVWLLRPPVVQVAGVAARDLAPAVHGVGTVEAKVLVNVSSKVTGRVVAVLVDQGDIIRAGQVLARIDDAQYAADADRGEANVRAAEAHLRDLLAGARPGELEQVRARLASAAATRTVAERDFARSRQLFDRELIAMQDLERTRQAYEVALHAERDARHALELAVEGPRRDQVDAARAELRAAQSALVLARANLAETAIVSPLNGYVVSRDLEVGAIVSPGARILKIADPATAWAVVHVDERDTGGLAPGDAAEIRLRSLPARVFAGRVARIGREGDRVTEQLVVDVAFAERPPRLILGEQVEVSIRLPARRGVSTLPLTAVVRRPDGAGALVVEDGRIRFAPATLGAVDPGGWVEVLGGLRPGADVVLAPGSLAERANDGRRVRVVRAEGS